MREEVVQALMDLQALRVRDADEEFDKMALVGTFARLLDARDEMTEALIRRAKAGERRESHVPVS